MKALSIVLLILLSSVSLFANVLTLAWDRNSETDIAGYNVYCNTTSGVYGPPQRVNTTLIPHPPANPVTYVYTTPMNIIYYCVVRAVNQAQLESDNSNEVVANPLPPKAPTNLTIPSLTSLLIDNRVVASTIGDNINYVQVIPRQTPPREIRQVLSVTVEPQ